MMDDQQRQDRHDQIIIQQYRELFERSNRYFAGLRELPQYGSKRLWQPYFQKTFDTYTQLWKYQLDHRQVLDRRYGLKRVEIGDIAAKIAQLYYHYYLRTSDIRYLQESFVFYEAIRNRKYFGDVKKENYVLYMKKLRFYARFIVVCLLQNKRLLVEGLLRELKETVMNSPSSTSPISNMNISNNNNNNNNNNNSHIVAPADNEWLLVINELESFMKADTVVAMEDHEDHDLLSYRMSKIIGYYSTNAKVSSSSSTTTTTLSQQQAEPIVLSEVILIGNRRKQVKFSELTLDMYRMMQATEYVNVFDSSNRRPSLGGGSLGTPRNNNSNNSNNSNSNSSNSSNNGNGNNKSESSHTMSSANSSGATMTTTTAGSSSTFKNPRKNMLYRPGYSEVLSVLSSSVSELDQVDNGAILLYISADATRDGLALNPKRRPQQASSSSSSLTSVSPPFSSTNSPSSASTSPIGTGSVNMSAFGMTMTADNSSVVDLHSLTMDDILPFTRKPFFMIVDSDNSACMSLVTPLANRQPRYGQPFVCLMSPKATIPLLQNPFQSGSLFTYYLTQPIFALACTHGIQRVSHVVHEQLSHYLIQQYTLLLDMLFSSDELHPSLRAFLDNDFLQRFLLNYLLCRVAMTRYYEEQVQQQQKKKKLITGATTMMTNGDGNSDEQQGSTVDQYLPVAFPEFTMVQQQQPLSEDGGEEAQASQEYQLLSDTIEYIVQALRRSPTTSNAV